MRIRWQRFLEIEEMLRSLLSNIWRQLRRPVGNGENVSSASTQIIVLKIYRHGGKAPPNK